MEELLAGNEMAGNLTLAVNIWEIDGERVKHKGKRGRETQSGRQSENQGGDRDIQ